MTRKYGDDSFDPSYCQMLIDHMTDGYAFDSFAADIEMDRSTLYIWLKKYPDFKRAYGVGKAKAQKYWEHRLMNKGFPETSVTAEIFVLKTRFHKNYGVQVKKIELTGKDGGPLKSETVKTEKFEDAVRRHKGEK